MATRESGTLSVRQSNAERVCDRITALANDFASGSGRPKWTARRRKLYASAVRAAHRYASREVVR